MKRLVWIASVAFTLAVPVTTARADLTITFQATPISQGGNGIIDIFLNTDSSGASINQYAFQVQIANNGADNTQLAFSTTQDFSYLNSTTPVPYVFQGDSDDFVQGSPAGGPALTIYPNDTFDAQDSTFTGNPATLSANSTYLLASLAITANTPAPPSVGDSFTISLIPGTGSGSINDSSTTYFDNFNYNEGVEVSATPFGSLPATLIIGPTTVPEPSSILSGLIGGSVLAVVGAGRRLRKKL